MTDLKCKCPGLNTAKKCENTSEKSIYENVLFYCLTSSYLSCICMTNITILYGQIYVARMHKVCK